MAKRYFPNKEERYAVEVKNNESDTYDSLKEINHTVYGYVNCGRLNIRTKPSIEADILCTVDRDSELLIDTNKNIEDWYSITTTAGVEGYCMKKFVTMFEEGR